MNSRERVQLALNHQEPDRIPLDLGGWLATGMHVSIVYALRQALGLDDPGTPVTVVEPYQMLGEIKADLMDVLGVDTVPLTSRTTLFGFKNEGWKPWVTFDGTPVLVPEAFNTTVEPTGELLMYPEGDRSAPPSGLMPAEGWYFDSIIRQPPIDDSNLNPEDNLEEFGPISEKELEHFGRESERLHAETDKAIFASFPGLGFGAISQVTAPFLKNPKGIRDIEEWWISMIARPDYIRAVFDRQCDILLSNLERIHEFVGNRITVVVTSATDFGMQTGPFISPTTYREVFKPFHVRVNTWIHQHTTWKTFMHSDGSIMPLIEDFIEAGFDILNPIQTSAANMDAREIKERFEDRIAFWGAGVDTQHTLPFGTPDEVRQEVLERLRIFGPGGGFVFNTCHNVQPNSPIENVLAMYETVREYGEYPLP